MLSMPSRMGRALRLALSALLLCAPVGYAQEEDEAETETETPQDDEPSEFERKGAYLMASGGWTVENFNKNDNPDTDSSWTVGAAWGYRANPNVATEVRFMWIDRLAKQRDRSNAVTTLIEESVQMWLLDWSLIVFYPIEFFQPYLKLGFGFMQGDFHGVNVKRHLGAEATFGGGADIYVTPHIAANLNIDYIVPISESIQDLQYALFTVGIKYRF